MPHSNNGKEDRVDLQTVFEARQKDAATATADHRTVWQYLIPMHFGDMPWMDLRYLLDSALRHVAEANDENGRENNEPPAEVVLDVRELGAIDWP